MDPNEHSNRLSTEFISLVEKINTLSNRTRSSEQPFLGALEQWRIESQQTLDSFCNEKRQTFINSRLEELNRLRTNVEELACVQDVTQQNTNSIKTSIDRIEQDINKIQFNFRPLLIDEHLIVRRSQDLLPFPPSNQVIELTDSSYAVLAGNKQHLLVHREPTLCLLDRQLTIIKETPWPLDDISDICWSSVLNRFIVINSQYVFILDERTMVLEQCLTSDTVNWIRGTCSDTKLYLSTEGIGSSISEYTLMPSIVLLKEWKSPVTCAHNEWIEDLKFHNDFLGLVIGRCKNNAVCFELRSTVTLNCLWSIQLEEVCSMYATRCCPMLNHQWIVVAFRNPRIFHISSGGKLISADKKCRSPSNICQIGSNLLAIWDQKCIYLQNLCCII
ncbi:unnamed protein product [Rotaria socialis]|uniref:Uncharacterized protein n=2 Tax=Rotaria socialis TaxID=392032 RepID=A0A821VIF8_9BILA|nr:unnamed protein product [Rotaria socialis]CAF4908829.1 unnamed protein product [Rotaria socialis]